MSSLRKHIHDDYIYMKRERAYNEKKRALLKLKKRKAAMRNSDEFYLKRVKTKNFGVFYKIKRRAVKSPEDDLEFILLTKEIKEIDVVLEGLSAERKAMRSELKELRKVAALGEIIQINLSMMVSLQKLEE